MDYFRIATELFTGYVALFFLTKILGKTQISQITAFDFISAIIVGELVGNALYDENVGIMDILITVLMWGFLIFLTEIITEKSQRWRKFLEGEPSIVIHKGKIDYKQLKKNHLDINQLQHLLRSKDVFSIRECEYAILETDGTISVMKKQPYSNVTLKDFQETTNSPRFLDLGWNGDKRQFSKHTKRRILAFE
ncbi:DUF421 domain-containing protein [Peribacillus tepidiphilus]|uniref:DUF421 domain-containing protein n=1 Tax=Peribacillus tepidiphilus TaxID=2652445 RepID=UPI0035B4FAC6